MSTTTEVQSLLRFLSQDARLPLSTAMGKIKELQKSSLTNPSLIAKSNLQTIQSALGDEKLAKQLLTAAKRVSKKRSSEDSALPKESSIKRRKNIPADEKSNDAVLFERSFCIPDAGATEAELETIVIITNRAPLVLAFAVTLLKYTMPWQPLSSRLSLAQAVVGLNSRRKALSLGLEKGASAEDEGWGQGQPVVRLMGNTIKVMKRWGYEWEECSKEGKVGNFEFKDSQDENMGKDNVIADDAPKNDSKGDDATSMDSKPQDNKGTQPPFKPYKSLLHSNLSSSQQTHPSSPSDDTPLWALDLEALRSSSTTSSSKSHSSSSISHLPIHTPQSAHSYLLKSFKTSSSSAPSSSKRPSKQEEKHRQEKNLALVLQALDLLYASWAPVLSAQELDRRTWGWYECVRPEVKQGVEGWGQRGEVRLGKVLDLRR
ncbi:hypothetical protein MMC31_000544 [Peltigera leucophlebia]|nr:hypothetical protein [Peltigera leucophlebia]